MTIVAPIRVDVLDPLDRSVAPWNLEERYAAHGIEADGGDRCRACSAAVGIPLVGDEDTPQAVHTVVVVVDGRRELLCADCADPLLAVLEVPR